MRRSGSASPTGSRSRLRRQPSLPRRSSCHRRTSTASCAGCAASAFARSWLTARSRSRRAGQSLRSGSPSRLAEKVQIVVGQYWWPWANFVVEPRDRQARLRADLRHERLRLARASMPSKARCSTPISPRRRWRRPSPSSLCSICRDEAVADIGGGYGGLLAALLGAHPQIEAVLFDRPHIIELPSPSCNRSTSRKRVRFVAGDLFAGSRCKPISIC